MQAAAWGFGGCAGELRIVRAFDAMGAQPVSESEAHWFLRQLARDVMGRYALARLLDAAGQPARARSPEELERAGQAAIARGAVRVVRGGPPPRTHVASTGAARAAEVYEDEPVAAVAP
ncbi:MAG: hypothetical protein H6719_38505, partial [Sandaracinaceae bacterium]|nr:hypothetical protein [Sandaracinaceae bacterium]